HYYCQVYDSSAYYIF
nr:immunoglobulin light chain junction region [Macaca mulatta]MOY09244.1 immunoglobulin light chain junction region [Macaca mulatta]